MSDYTQEFGSECCMADAREIPQVIIKEEPGVTAYLHHECLKCGKPCGIDLRRLWDSEGVEVLPGDVLETPGVPFPDHAERWHIAYKAWYTKGLEVRDLGNNNVTMYTFWGPVFNRGHWTKHRDKITDEDIEYYNLEQISSQANVSDDKSEG